MWHRILQEHALVEVMLLKSQTLSLLRSKSEDKFHSLEPIALSILCWQSTSVCLSIDSTVLRSPCAVWQCAQQGSCRWRRLPLGSVSCVRCQVNSCLTTRIRTWCHSGESVCKKRCCIVSVAMSDQVLVGYVQLHFRHHRIRLHCRVRASLPRHTTLCTNLTQNDVHYACLADAANQCVTAHDSGNSLLAGLSEMALPSPLKASR